MKSKITIGALLLALPLALLLAGFAARTVRAADYWPTDGWRHAVPEAQGMASKPLADLLADIHEFEHRIDSVTVVRNGYLVLDSYFHPFKKGDRHVVYSNTKSVISALIGIAMDRGEIKNLTLPVRGFFPRREIANLDTRKRALTLEHLLTMTAGFDCRDNFRHRWVGLRAMRRSPDWTQYVLDLPMAEPPGQGFDYCNGVSFLLSAILQKAIKTTALGYARKHLFAPLGISDVVWPSSPNGITIGYSKLSLKPHDMAKFGWLYLNKGNWDGRQIISKAWVEKSTRRHVDATIFDYYGYQWWRDGAGFYMAVGYKGQFIFVVPEKNLVAVFTSNLGLGNFKVPVKLLTRYIIPAVRSKSALAPNPAQQARLAKLSQKRVIAPPREIIWRTAAEGVVRDGMFFRAAAPSFHFRVSPGSRKLPLVTPRQVMRMQSSSNFRFHANVTQIPKGITLAEAGPRALVRLLRAIATDVVVTRNEGIRLADGTPAYQTDLSWRYKSYKRTSQVVSVFRDGKWVLLAAHPRQWSQAAADIVKSLSFKKPD